MPPHKNIASQSPKEAYDNHFVYSQIGKYHPFGCEKDCSISGQPISTPVAVAPTTALFGVISSGGRAEVYGV